MSASFGGILLSGQATNEGRLELSADAAVWTARTGDSRRAIDLRRVGAAHWIDAGRACQLWLREGAPSAEGGAGSAGAGAAPWSGGELHRFEGFKVPEFEKVAGVLESSPVAGTLAGGAPGAGVKLQKLKPSARGRNWGTWVMSGKTLEWHELGSTLSGGAPGPLIAAIPLASVAQAVYTGKGEVDLQFLDEDVVEREDEVCVEMRLHVPAGHRLPDAAVAAEAAKKRAQAKAARGGAGAGEEEEEAGRADEIAAAVEEAGADPAAQLQALVSEGAGVAAGAGAGEALAELGEEHGQFLVPRGRFAIELYPAFLRLVGKSYEFKVAYKSIGRMFYLPKPNPAGSEANRYFLVIGLEDPLRHGSQRHAHLVLQLERKAVSVPLNIPDEDVRAGRYEGLGKESQTSEGELPRVLASLLKHISGKPIFKPGNFGGAAGPSTKAVRCSCKSNDGFLYPLEKSMLFVHKPTLWIRYADISSLEFRRSGVGGSRSWEMAVNVKSGVATGVAGELLFQSLDKGEWEPLRSYLTERGVTVTEGAFGGGALPSRGYAEAGSDDDEGDDDGAAKRARGGDDDDEDSSDDESYHGEGGSDDDDDDDDDGGASASGSEDEDAGFSKKKKKSKSKKPAASAGKDKAKGKASKKPKAKRARKGSDDDDGDDDDE